MICNTQVKESFVLRQSIKLHLDSQRVFFATHCLPLWVTGNWTWSSCAKVGEEFSRILLSLRTMKPGFQKTPCRRKDVKMDLKRLQGVRGRKVTRGLWLRNLKSGIISLSFIAFGDQCHSTVQSPATLGNNQALERLHGVLLQGCMHVSVGSCLCLSERSKLWAQRKDWSFCLRLLMEMHWGFA